MTISGREQNPSDDYTINDPYILPVHMYRAPPPAYEEVAKPKPGTSTSPQQVDGYDNTAMVPDSEINNNHSRTPSEAPPAYENIQPSSN